MATTSCTESGEKPADIGTMIPQSCCFEIVCIDFGGQGFMHNLFYIIGVVVVVLFILSVLGLA